MTTVTQRMLTPVVMTWPINLGYDGEILCGKCLDELRGNDGRRLGGELPGQAEDVTSVGYVIGSLWLHVNKCQGFPGSPQ